MTFIQSTSESFIQPTVGDPTSPSQRTDKKRVLVDKTQSTPKRAKTTETDDKIKFAQVRSHSKKTNPDEIPSPKSRKISVKSSGGEHHHKAPGKDSAAVSSSLKEVAEALIELRCSPSPKATPPDLSFTPAAISMPPPPPRTSRLSQGRSPGPEIDIKLLKEQYIELGLRFAQFGEQFGPKVQALKNELQEAQTKLLTFEMREPILAKQLMNVTILAREVMALSANLNQKQKECDLLQESQIQFQQRLDEQEKGFSMTTRLHEAEVSALRSSEYEAKEDAAKSRSELEYTLQQFVRESEIHRAVLKTLEAAKIEITQVKSQFQNAFREQSLLASRTIEDLRSQVLSDASIIESSKTTIRELESHIKTLREDFKELPDDLGYQPFEFEL